MLQTVVRYSRDLMTLHV